MNAVEDTGNLPKWPGAAACYSKLYRLLEIISRRQGQKAGWPMQSTHCRRSDSTIVCTEQMEAIIDALNKGDEERIKWYCLEFDAIVNGSQYSP